ncbi:MAG: CoA-binding protein [bacterium]|nr:CoA-binding protein [bacterium]
MSRAIAIVGASANRSKFGNKAVRAYLAEGWTVYPVNRSGGDIEDLEAVPRLSDLKAQLDRISVYLPPPITLELLPEIAATGAREVWFNPGSADERVLRAAEDLGLPVHPACSIVDIGRHPSEFH